ncbi:hypothetical protein [Paenibacillus marinisediminis]
MDYRKYYVSVHHRTILLEPSEGVDLEIEATEAQVDQLYKLIGQVADEESDAMYEHFMLFTKETNDQINQQYDRRLHELYQELYRLGTANTRAFIEQHIGGS